MWSGAETGGACNPSGNCPAVEKNGVLLCQKEYPLSVPANRAVKPEEFAGERRLCDEDYCTEKSEDSLPSAAAVISYQKGSRLIGRIFPRAEHRKTPETLCLRGSFLFLRGDMSYMAR